MNFIDRHMRFKRTVYVDDRGESAFFLWKWVLYDCNMLLLSVILSLTGTPIMHIMAQKILDASIAVVQWALYNIYYAGYHIYWLIFYLKTHGILYVNHGKNDLY